MLQRPISVIKKGHPRELKRLLLEYEKYLSPAAMVFGFIVDSLTLTKADVWLDNVILLSYLLIAGASILILNSYEASFRDGLPTGIFKNPKIEKLILLLPLAIQFAFGGLFSGFVVLYSRSASILVSWPFLATLIALLIGNEYSRHRYRILIFQTAVYFVAVFSYFIFAVPVILNSIGPIIFLLSGVVSLSAISLIVWLISKTAPQKFESYRRAVKYSILGIYIAFNLLYFTDIIPPIPLSLKDIVVAHSISHIDNNRFQISFESPRWYNFLSDFNSTYHRLDNEPIYIFTTIYAPAKLKTNIIHEWSHFEESKKEWVVKSRLEYSLFGGREQGYRGYSFKTVVEPGKWKVAVKTKTGQTLGRTRFKIIPVSSPPELRTEIR